MISFDAVVKEFEPGSKFYEDVYGRRFEYVVVSGPIVEGDQVMWSAMKYDGGTQEFLITKGLEHYGPKLYWNDRQYD